jgi:hypothetical protein
MVRYDWCGKRGCRVADCRGVYRRGVCVDAGRVGVRRCSSREIMMNTKPLAWVWLRQPFDVAVGHGSSWGLKGWLRAPRVVVRVVK